jgi:hypothetical protein
MTLIGDRIALVRGAIAKGIVSLGQMARLESGDGTKGLYGDGTFKTPGGGGLAVNAHVTPHPGGGQASATQLAAGITPVGPPATSGDSVQLPDAVAGAIVMLLPSGSFAGFTVSVYVKDGSSDTLNGLSDFVDFGASFSTAAPLTPCWFVCVVNGAWWTNGGLD